MVIPFEWFEFLVDPKSLKNQNNLKYVQLSGSDCAMMFALTLLRILLALSLFFVLCSSQKSFLKGMSAVRVLSWLWFSILRYLWKGLLIGSILGHKKGALLHEKGEQKEVHKEYYPAPEKEYVPVPVHEEPRFIPI